MKKQNAYDIFSFYQIFIFSQGWTLWHSSSKSRAFAAVGKCTRSENPAQEMRTLLVYWSAPYKILTECTLIADIKGASIHTDIHPFDMEKRKETWNRLKKQFIPVQPTTSIPPQKNQARYYDLFKCFQLKLLLKYCSMEVFNIKGG